jgi:hypothetical protein
MQNILEIPANRLNGLEIAFDVLAYDCFASNHYKVGRKVTAGYYAMRRPLPHGKAP